MNDKYIYRLIKSGEEKNTYELILKVFYEYVASSYSQKGINTFINMISPEVLKEMQKTSDQFVMVADYQNQIVGMAAIKNMNHIALLFVDSAFQKQGIGKSLIQAALKICQEKNTDLEFITVSSSPNSLSFYESLGFNIEAEEVNENGMRFIPMKKQIYKQSS
ncbi:MAG: GNAT family N-acetyltransferase [bacterium]